MNANRRIQFIVFLMLIGLTTATITNVALNFREYGYTNAHEKARMTAAIVRDGLTAHMVNDTMDSRQFFLENIAKLKDVQNLWIVRSPNVIAQHGEGFPNERPRDAIDKKVLSTGQEIIYEKEDSKNAILRVSIPFIASAHDNPNCLSCHVAKEGEVLGAISMEFDINDIRQTGALTIAKILGINLLFIIIALWVTHHYFKPYMQIFENLQQGIKRARTGDFSFRFTSTLKGEGGEVAEQMNTLFEKIDNTFGGIRHDLGTFMSQANISCSDPLNNAGMIIKELSDVYKFKKKIELDNTKDEIYDRFIYILKEKFKIEHFAFYEIDKVTKNRRLIHLSGDKNFCEPIVDHDIIECRAYRTLSDVYSTDFMFACKNCSMNDKEYTCIPFNINNDLALTLSYWSDDTQTIEFLNQSLPSIKNYFEVAKAVLESRTLTDRLRDSSLRDGATKLYNRRFMEEFIDTSIEQALRSKTTYSILMIDIDYFKMVNDTYGHDSGDLVIKSLAEILQSTVRKADLPIRYGGEEFLILLHNTDCEGALGVAEKIRTQFAAKKYQFGSDSITKTLSIGIAHFPSDSDSIWKVIKFADLALYEAKHTGRNRTIEFKAEMFKGGNEF